MKTRLLFLAAICIITGGAAIVAEPSDAELLQRLDGHLNAIRAEAEFSRILSGSVFIGVGGLYAGAGILMNSMITYSSSITDTISYLFYGMAGGLGLLGLLVLSLPSEYESLPKDFRGLSEIESSEIKAKIAKGEGYLSSLSSKSRSSRMLSAVICGVVGGGMIVMHFSYWGSAYPPSYSSSSYDPYTFGSVYLYTGIVSLSCAILTLLLKSRAENEYDSYVSWKSGKSVAGRENAVSVEFVSFRNSIGFAVRY
jgi:hypothetical protein